MDDKCFYFKMKQRFQMKNDIYLKVGTRIFFFKYLLFYSYTFFLQIIQTHRRFKSF